MRLRNGILAIALFGLAACGQGTPVSTGPVDLANVVLKIGDQKGGSKTLLTTAGLDKTPYKIEWSTFSSGPPLLEAASAGGIDIGAVGNTPPIFAAAAKAKIAIVSSSKGNVESDALLVPQGSSLRAIEDLRGKSIAVAKGSSAHGQILLTLKKAGLSTQDVKLNFLQPADAYAAFTQKRVDAWAIWDPYTSQAKLEAGAQVLTDGRGVANGYTFQVAGQAALADPGKNAAIKDYVTRIAKAQKWSDAHREDWAKAWAAETGLPVNVTLAATAQGPDLPVPLDDTVIGSEQELTNAFTDDKVLPSTVDFAGFVDKRYAADLGSVQ
ncbi:ABC transporter substrate-binding protein [Kibdelosporangium philippinense]|uniref:ABC transporter substrate-binding protein n=1 Tax=Kibdelosporangium philippinense TaxID=211113 RepID=A0ABS8ZBR1_9PSEU|nr:ABC transporter substrate-binding protein [Kibdelosporangium philippinense]MCE7005294.1 ABC transporter substrate-binding protein [Kibdelosporangium philippinense]